jgi:apolipoprotein N-acyltransferase
MWLLHFIPDSFLIWVVNITCIVGLSATVLGFFLGWVPFVNRYKTPLQILGVVLLTVGVYWKGGYSTEMEWRTKVNEMQAKVDVAEQKSKQANAKLKSKVTTKIKVIHDTQIIVKKQIVEKAAAIDAECKVSPDAINILNSLALPTSGNPVEAIVVKPGDGK